MAVTVEINGVNKSSFVDWHSLQIEQVLTYQVDSCSFDILVYGATKTYVPAVNDTVTVKNGTTKIFEGKIVGLDLKVEAKVQRWHIQCKDWTELLDRRLVIQSVSALPFRYVLNNIADEFLNVDKTLQISDFETLTGWSATGGTQALNTTNIMEAAASLKITNVTGGDDYSVKNTVANLALFDDGITASVASDYVTAWIYINDVSKLNAVAELITFSTDAGATNRYAIKRSTTGVPVLANGWNYLRVLKSDMTVAGTPTFAGIAYTFVHAHGLAGLEISFDDLRIISGSEGFYLDSVPEIGTVQYGSFNYEPASQVFQQLAELFVADWFVDYDRVLHFFVKGAVTAPFGLTDTGGKFFNDTLKINNSTDQIRNAIYVRGAEYKGSASFEEQKADGTALVYKFGYRYSDYTIKVAGVTKTVGLDNIDDPTTVDCLYNFTEKAIKFKTATKPAVGETIRIDGNPFLPLLVLSEDTASIASYGRHEIHIVDKTIVTKEAGKQRAVAELNNWASKIVEGSFETNETSLRVGQQININSSFLGLNADYIINRITLTMREPTGTMRSSVSLVTTKTFGMVDFLRSLIIKKDKEITVNPNEVLDKVVNVYDDVTITDVVAVGSSTSVTESAAISEVTTVQAVNFGTQFVAGDNVPPASTTAIELNSSTLFSDGNLIAYYRLEANANDSKGANHGTSTAITYSAGNGKFNNGAGFNGSTSRIYAQYAAFDIFGSSPLSYSFWMKVTALPSTASSFYNVATIQEGATDNTYDKAIRLYGDGSISMYAWDGAAKSALAAAGTITAGAWNLITGTYDGSFLRIYVNGTFKAAVACSATYNFTTPRLVLSQTITADPLSEMFSGSIDDLAFFSRALSGGDISNLFTSGTGRQAIAGFSLAIS